MLRAKCQDAHYATDGVISKLRKGIQLFGFYCLDDDTHVGMAPADY